MSDELCILDDLFAVPSGPDEFYLYAPLRRAVAKVNQAAVSVVANYLKGGNQHCDEKARAILSSLEQAGLIGGTPRPPPLFPPDYEFCPHEVTLFITSRCNLRCRYCYADAGRKSIDMDECIARAAIDLVASNAGLLGNKSFAVGFHGGGEPSVAWDLLVHCVDYARKKSDETGLDVQIFSATNGVLSPEQRTYIAKYFSTVTISLDGPRDIQDHNRPRANGQGSYDEVADTLRFFNDEGFFYSVRSTITSDNVHRMEEIVTQLSEAFHISDLHLEPAWCCGRCITSGAKSPSDEAFIEHFSRAVAAGKRLGVHVHYSGARVDVLTSKFCAAPGDGFSVLPEGAVTSCFEITEHSDPRSAIFHYGMFDPETGGFQFDREKIRALQRFSVENIEFCGDCFCKWHCAGDCLAKVFQKSGAATHKGSLRCNINRVLTQQQLAELVQQEADGNPASQII